MINPDKQFDLSKDDDEFALHMWEGDESVKGEVLIRYGPALEKSIARRFPRLHSGEAEDVVCEAIRRFWESRDRYDPSIRPIRVLLYRICWQVATEYVTGHFSWQKARKLERSLDAAYSVAGPDDAEELELDAIENQNPAFIKTFGETFGRLDPIDREIWQAFADADGYPVDATQLGIELGIKYGGTPIPGGTIRQRKRRAKQWLFAEMKNRGYDLKELGYSDA